MSFKSMMLLTEIELLETPDDCELLTLNNQKTACIEENEYEFISQCLQRWRDRDYNRLK